VTDNRFGGTLGAGIEYAFLPGWSVKLEYDYYDFGKHSMVMPIAGSVALGANTTPFSVTAPINVNEQIHTIRIGVNYNFNSPAVARY
jgi:outer membrane immunogenic protein